MGAVHRPRSVLSAFATLDYGRVKKQVYKERAKVWLDSHPVCSSNQWVSSVMYYVTSFFPVLSWRVLICMVSHLLIYIITIPIKHVISGSNIPLNFIKFIQLYHFFLFSGGGLVLERMINSYNGSEVFQPVINGIGGNLVSVQASRMSTMLHQSSIMGILPPHGKIWVFPWTALFIGCTKFCVNE